MPKSSSPSASELTSPRASSLPLAVRRHDYFNLVYLLVLNALNLLNIFDQCDFHIFWWTTMCYFIADALFVSLSPSCVKVSASHK
jgi:hypothetical protein